MGVTLSNVVPANPEEAKHMQPRVIELLHAIAHAVQSRVLVDMHMCNCLQRPTARIDCSGMANKMLQWTQLVTRHPGSFNCPSRKSRLFWVSSLTDVRWCFPTNPYASKASRWASHWKLWRSLASPATRGQQDFCSAQWACIAQHQSPFARAAMDLTYSAG